VSTHLQDGINPVPVDGTPILDDAIDSDPFKLGNEGFPVEMEKNDPHTMQSGEWW